MKKNILVLSFLVLAFCEFDPYCMVKNEGGICKECFHFYYLKDGKCRQVAINCKQYDRVTGQCLSCSEGYLLKNGKCLGSLSGPLPRVRLQEAKHIQNLGSASYQNHKIMDNDFTASNRTLPAAIIDQPINQMKLQISNSQSTGNKSFMGFDPLCQTYDKNNQCIKCSFRSYFDKHSGVCSLVNPQCKTYDESNGVCLSCYLGYHLWNGECLVGGKQNKNCKIFNEENKCVECYSGYLAVDGVCQLANPQCKTYDPSGACTSCYDGYFIAGRNCVVSSKINKTDLAQAQISSSNMAIQTLLPLTLTSKPNPIKPIDLIPL